jgi:hypothetical protein
VTSSFDTVCICALRFCARSLLRFSLIHAGTHAAMVSQCLSKRSQDLLVCLCTGGGWSPFLSVIPASPSSFRGLPGPGSATVSDRKLREFRCCYPTASPENHQKPNFYPLSQRTPANQETTRPASYSQSPPIPVTS